MKCYRHLQSFGKIVSCSRSDFKSSSLSCLNANFSQAGQVDMKKCWQMCFKSVMQHTQHWHLVVFSSQKGIRVTL